MDISFPLVGIAGKTTEFLIFTSLNESCMKSLIENFTQHLGKSIETCELNGELSFSKKIENVLICGLGGSGIGGTIITQVVAKDSACPIMVNKDYKIPGFVNENTLVIISSYSGNTEESLEMLTQAEAKNAEIACVTSGGKLMEIAQKKNYPHIIIPGGNPPRAAFGLSFPVLFYFLQQYKVVSENYTKQFTNSIALLDAEEDRIVSQAKSVAASLMNKIPIIYAESWFEGVAVRFRQQVNENAKMLCWHHVIPEMNHNELVGWTQANEDLVVVIFRNDSDYSRNQQRMEINKTVIQKYTSTIIEIYSKGETRLEQSLFLIHLGDWVSYFLGENRGVDVTEVDVITSLKNELAKV